MGNTLKSNTALPPFVVQDLVIDEENCNLSCSYCLTGQSNFKKSHLDQNIFKAPRRTSCRPGTPLYRRLRQVTRETRRLRVPVLKLSGGEVMLIEGIDEFIEEMSACYETVVLLTNGMLISPARAERLSSLGNVVLQISLDSTRYEGNSYRVHSARIHAFLIRRLRHLCRTFQSVEVYGLIHDRSAPFLVETAEELAGWTESSNLAFYPFPVRGPDRNRFQPGRDQLESVQRLIGSAREGSPVLPPLAYLLRLESFFRNGGRRFACHLPRMAFGTFSDGKLTSCPNIWFDHAGDLMGRERSQALQGLARSRFRQLLLSERPRIEACRACFSPWDLATLYLEGVLTADELFSAPMYRGERTRHRMSAIRSRLRESKRRTVC